MFTALKAFKLSPVRRMEAVRESHRRWMKNVRDTTGYHQTNEDAKEWFHHRGWFEPTVATMRLRGKHLIEMNDESVWYAERVLKDDAAVRILRDFHVYIVEELEKLGVVVYHPDDNLKLN